MTDLLTQEVIDYQRNRLADGYDIDHDGPNTGPCPACVANQAREATILAVLEAAFEWKGAYGDFVEGDADECMLAYMRKRDALLALISVEVPE